MTAFHVAVAVNVFLELCSFSAFSPIGYVMSP